MKFSAPLLLHCNACYLWLACFVGLVNWPCILFLAPPLLQSPEDPTNEASAGKPSACEPHEAAAALEREGRKRAERAGRGERRGEEGQVGANLIWFVIRGEAIPLPYSMSLCRVTGTRALALPGSDWAVYCRGSRCRSRAILLCLVSDSDAQLSLFSLARDEPLGGERVRRAAGEEAQGCTPRM
jgi:hypothetical protein